MKPIQRTVWLVIAACQFLMASSSAEDFLIPDIAKPGDGALILTERIYSLADRPTPQCHASTLVETNDGLAAAWFGGTREKNPDVGIWFSRNIDGKWSTPVELVDGSENESQEYACWNPVLFQPRDGPLMLFYKVGLTPRDWWGAWITSDDEGQTWSKPKRLGTDDALPKANQNLLGPVKNKPIQLADGAILCPTSTENEGWKVHFEITRDLGATWEVIGPIQSSSDAVEFNAIQPSVLKHSDGRIQILCRTQEDVIAQSWSDDDGRSWSALSATSLPNPNSGTDAVTLRDGRQLLVYNHTRKRGSFPSNRSMLNVAISSDGSTWKPVSTLERQEGEFSYPAVIQTRDGNIHITYTWNRRSIQHAVLDPTKLH